MQKGTIYNYHLEIQQWQKIGSVLLHFHRSKIQEFYKEYTSRLEKIFKEVTQVQDQHFEYEGDKVKEVDGKPVYKEGKTEEDFNTAMHELMSQQVAEKLHLIRP